MQALAKDLPWKLKESRVLEILQAVNTPFLGLSLPRHEKGEKFSYLLLFPVDMVYNL